LLFREELPTRDELALIYAESYFAQGSGDTEGQGYLDYLADEPSHRRIARDRLQILARHSRPGRLLDVGAAAGFFVDEARTLGWHAEGVDVAEEIVSWGRRTLGAEMTHGELADLGQPTESLDAVTMWDYIEHSRDPTRDVRTAHRFLRTRGIIAVTTGDVGALLPRLTGSRWHLLTPRHHNFFFSRRTLQALLERNGFSVLYSAHPGATYSLAYLAHKLRTFRDGPAVRSSAEKLARSRVGNLRVPVNLRDIVTIVARKT